MQEAAVAVIVALAASVLAIKALRSALRRFRPKGNAGQDTCGKCRKCG